MVKIQTGTDIHRFSCIDTFVRVNYDCALLCIYLKVDSAKSFKILSEANPRAYLVANRIS